jgi:hypothetical protein
MDVDSGGRYRANDFWPDLGPQFFGFRDRQFSGTEKSPIDKMLDREFRSNARRDFRFRGPPRRAGMVAVRAVYWWL